MQMSFGVSPRIAAAVVTGLFAGPALAADVIMPAARAIEVRDVLLFQQMFFEACGKATGDAETYIRVWEEWSRQNFYHGDVADRVLAHHGVTFDPGRNRDTNETAIAMSLGEADNARAYCAAAGLAAGKDTLNLRALRPDLFEMLVVSDRVLRKQKP